MNLFVYSLFITLLVLPPVLAADDTLASGAASLYHLASLLGIEVSLEEVENTVVQKAQGPYVVNFVIIDTARDIDIELQERDLNYDQLQALETPVIVCLKAAFDAEIPSEIDTTAAADFIVVESATEKSVRVFGASQKSSRAASTLISRALFFEHWTGQVLTLTPPLSTEAIQLLEDIKTGTAAYNAKLKSGEIEFSITLSERIRPKEHFLDNFPWLMNILKVKKKEEVRCEDVGYWHITYRFDGDHHFYDVKMRKKVELSGSPLRNWHESHLQYQMERKTLYFREKPGTEWQQQSLHKRRPAFGRNMPSDVFEEKFNPRWWSWPPWGFKLENLISVFKPINVQQVNVEGILYTHLTLHRTDSHLTRTSEIWLDPEKDYRPTRLLEHERAVLERFIQRRDGKLEPLPREKEYRLTSYTHQLVQFEPNIWFPKIVTMKYLSVVGDEDKQPRPFRKIIMEVHRAVFNIPITEKDLGITSDR